MIPGTPRLLSERYMEIAKRELEYLRYAHRTSVIREVVRERLDGYDARPRGLKAGRKRPIIPSRFAKLIAEVEERHGLQKNSIFHQTNVRMFVEARCEAYLALREAGLSYPYIGFIFGQHHTTVLHHVRKAQVACGKTLEATNGSV